MWLVALMTSQAGFGFEAHIPTQSIGTSIWPSMLIYVFAETLLVDDFKE